MSTAGPPPVPSASSAKPRAAFAAIALQLLLLLLVIRLFRVEERRGLFALALLAAAGLAVYRALPVPRRPLGFLALSLAAFPLAFAWPRLPGSLFEPNALPQTAAAFAHGLPQAALLLGVGLGLIGLCHLPAPLPARVALIAAAAGGLIVWRSRDLSPFWAVLGSIFMFRLWVYLRALRSDADPAPWPLRLSYFFLLPNAFFPFFPIVDYRKFRDGYRPDDSGAVAQRGVSWILRGIGHLLAYRIIRTFWLPGPLDLINAEYVFLFLVTNYALYLQVSGHFHVITGLLHLFGFDLPRTHDAYFLASSLSDIWRRINIYWKDFLADHVFFPAFFALRRLPRWAAIAAGVGVTFVATWLLHSWQTFWLLGRFPLAGRDAALWLTAGTLVAVNSLWQYRAALRGRPKPATLTPAAALRRTLRIVGTFLTVSFFWACWTVPGFPRLVAAAAAAGGFTQEHLAKPAAALLAVVACGTAAGIAADRFRRRGVAIRSPLDRSAAACVAALLALAAVGQPEFHRLLGHDISRAVAALQFDEPPLADALEGYYGRLAEANLQSAPLLDAARQLPRPDGVTYGEISREVGGLLGSELRPGRTPSVYGVPFRVNRWGMRDDDLPRPKPPGTYRVALLGSSTTMGHRVAQDEDFESLLERKINEALPPGGPSRVELLNFGNPGYYAIHLAALLQDKAFAFEPDAVYYVAHQGEYFSLGKHLARGFKAGDPLPYACLGEIARRAGVTAETSPGMADQLVQPLAKEILACTYAGIAADCRRRGVVPVWIYVPIPEVTKVQIDEAELKETARRAGFVVIDLSGWPGDRTAEDLKFDETDYHANALGHRLIADRLYAALKANPEALPLLEPASPIPATPP